MRGVGYRIEANVKRWPIRSRLAVWTAFFLTIELVIFGVASGWVIYNDQLEAFAKSRRQPGSPIVIKKETAELVFDLTSAYLTAFPAAAFVCRVRRLVDHPQIAKAASRCRRRGRANPRQST